MQEIDRNDSTEAIDSLVRINIPHYGIDLRVIFLAISDKLPYYKFRFGPEFNMRNHIVVPTLKFKFITYPRDGYLIIYYRGSVKVKMELEEDKLSEKTIDIICDYLERIQINYPIF